MYRQVLEESDGELNKAKQKEKKLLETEELSFHLQSGLVLCKLAVRIVPTAAINVDSLQVRIASSFSSPTSSLISRLATWWPRGRISLSSWQQLLPMEYQNTFSSDQMIWPFRHTSTSNIAHLFTGYDLLLFQGDPHTFCLCRADQYGPRLCWPRVWFWQDYQGADDEGAEYVCKHSSNHGLLLQGIRRKSSIQDTCNLQTNINSIFANLMQVCHEGINPEIFNPSFYYQDVERRNSITPKGPPANIYACDWYVLPLLLISKYL